MSDKPRVKLHWNGEKYVPLQPLSPMPVDAREQAADASRKMLIEQRLVKMKYERGELGPITGE